MEAGFQLLPAVVGKGPGALGALLEQERGQTGCAVVLEGNVPSEDGVSKPRPPGVPPNPGGSPPSPGPAPPWPGGLGGSDVLEQPPLWAPWALLPGVGGPPATLLCQRLDREVDPSRPKAFFALSVQMIPVHASASRSKHPVARLTLAPGV